MTIYQRIAFQVSEEYPSGVATLQLAITLGTAMGAAANGIAQLGFAKGFNPKELAAGALTRPSLHALIMGDSFAKSLCFGFALLSLSIALKLSFNKTKTTVNS